MNDPNTLDPVHTEKHSRRSFLLRLWSAGEAGRLSWRASLEMPGTGKRIGFASLEQLFVYLLDLCESRNGVADEDAEPGPSS